MNTLFPLSKFASMEDRDRAMGFHYTSLAKTIGANVKNEKLSDAEFRQFVINSLSEMIPAEKVPS